jgi:hypothetical protein
MDLPASQFPRPKKFLQHGGVTGIWELGIQVVAYEVEKGFEVGIAGVLGYLFTAFIEADQKGKNFFR